MLKKITESPYLNLLSGFILLITAGYETCMSYIEAEEASIGVRHGVLVFSIVHILKTLPEVLHGLKEVEEAKEAKN